MNADPCHDMGCKHPRASHETWGRCTERRAYYNERLYGYDQPVIYRTCDCSEWKPSTYLTPRAVTDGPQA